jgi:hypothetical protein
MSTCEPIQVFKPRWNLATFAKLFMKIHSFLRTLPPVTGNTSQRPGFALVVTLSLMILLTVIAVGLLSLSSISLRSSTQAAAMAEARANARLALMLALGDLQKSAGPDTRVTATADTLDATSTVNSPLTGVWKSWENSDLDAGGLPIAPTYNAKSTNVTNNGRFLQWLISQPMPANPSPTLPPVITPSAGSVPLVDTGTLGISAPATGKVHAVPLRISSAKSSGGYAWWVGGENAKANLAGVRTQPSTLIESRDALASRSSPSPKPFGLAVDPALKPRLVSRNSLALATLPSPPTAKLPFHDLTTSSRGLLTNTSSGGWRKDLSLLAEYGLANSSSSPTPGSPSATGFLYPFSFAGGTGYSFYNQYPAIIRWPAFLDALTLYRSNGGLGQPKDFSSSAGVAGQLDSNYFDKVIRMPVVADIRFVLSYSAVPSATIPDSFDAAIAINPVVTLWNPWNYRISVDELKIRTSPLPLDIDFKLTDGTSTKLMNINLFELFNSTTTSLVLSKIQLELKTGTSSIVALDPGETRVFSTSDPNLADFDPTSNTNLIVTLQQGTRTEGGYRIIIKKGAPGSQETLTGSANAQLQITKMGLAYKNIYFGNANPPTENLTGNALQFSAKIGGTVKQYAPVRLQFRPAVAESYYPPITFFPELPLQEVAADNAVFASSSLRFRTCNDTRFPARVGFNSSVTATCIEAGIGAYKGTTPHSSPIEFDVWEHGNWGESRLPNNNGYILTGVDDKTGITRCILHEISLRPPRSLGELTHLQLRGPNPFPPHRTNIIANSAAHPICPPDQVKVPLGAWANNAMQFDDSYIANRFLFDDWFLSSIAPETTGWSGNTLRSLERVYQDHVALSKALPNSAYLPTTKANATTDLSANTRHTTIASRIEVEGMFNINSTSVLAWKSLLGHSRDSDVPVLGPTGLSSSSGSGHPISRTTAAGDVSADEAGLPGHNKFAGHRRLTDDQIDALAEEIVKQIRSRGPALSLSEFVNRQLRASSDPRALAGPIQAALEELAKKIGSTNPYSELQARCVKITLADVPANAEYGFREAAVGWTGDGLPGWITQADILRPIAPVISARDDTFVIRTCGISYAPDGTTVRAKVWSEAVIRRQPEYVAPNTSADPASDGNLTGANGPINTTFGRRIEIVSFRYLSPTEI